MRGLTSTIVLIVVLAGLVGYIYFVDADRPASGTEVKPKAFDVAMDNIEEVQVKNASGETSRLQRVDTTWQLVEPQKTAADEGVVSSLTGSLASLEVQRVVDENPTDLKQYGLNPPRLDLTFRLKDQKEPQRLLVGDKTPTGDDLYAKKPDEARVFLISSFLDATFNKTPFELRDKAILKVDRDASDGIELSRGATTLQLSRTGTEWRIVKPITARADYAAVEGVMTRLSSAQMQKVVEEEAKDLKRYGLDAPMVSATVTGGSSRATLLIGRAQGEGGLFAKDASRPMVFTVEDSLATDLGKDLSEFRRKDMFDSRSFTANRVELRRGADTVAFEKTKDTDGKEVWRNASGQNADTAKVEDLLTKLSNLRAQSFEPTPNASLKTPVLTATVRFDENKTETVTFGRQGSDVFASRPDEPGSARLEASVFDEVMKALDGVK
jgi:hypothetical protein